MPTTTTQHVGFKLNDDGDRDDDNWGQNLRDNWEILDEHIRKNGTSNPNGLVIGDYTGQPYRRTTNQDRFICTVAGDAQTAQWAGIYADAHVWEKTQSANWNVLSGTSVAPDLSLGNFFSITLTGDITILNPINAGSLAAVTFLLVVKQDSVARTITWGTQYKWTRGSAAVLTQQAQAVDVFSFAKGPFGNFLGAQTADVR